MLKQLRTLFAPPKQNKKERQQADDPIRTAVATLLVEAALFNDEFDARERAQIQKLLCQRYALPEAEADALIAHVRAWAENPNNIYRLTKTLKDALPHDERIALIEMLFEVVYADGTFDDFEANLLRRMGGLLYVTDQERGAARKRVCTRLGIDETERAG